MRMVCGNLVSPRGCLSNSRVDECLYKIEQILTDRNINESDPLVKVANITSTLIFPTLQYCLAGVNPSLSNSAQSFISSRIGMD